MKPHLFLVMLVHASVAACASPAGRVPGAAEPVAQLETPRPERRCPGPVDARHEILPDPVVSRLVGSVESLVQRGVDADGDQLAGSLRSLASTLELLPGATWRPVNSIREAAGEVSDEASSENSRTRSVRDALHAAARVLVDVDCPAAPAAEFQVAVAAASAALDEFDAELPQAQQVRSMLRALRAMADAILVAGGRQRRFTRPPSPLGPGDAGTFAGRVAAATAAVEDLARATAPEPRSTAARALRALAEAIEAAPDKPGKLAGLVAEIRHQAERLRRADPLAFGDTRWIQTGLSAALDALAAMPVGRTPAVGPWVDDARRAIQAIAGGRSLGFQRAAVQDAFRAVVVAFSAAARGCPCGDRTRARAPGAS